MKLVVVVLVLLVALASVVAANTAPDAADLAKKRRLRELLASANREELERQFGDVMRKNPVFQQIQEYREKVDEMASVLKKTEDLVKARVAAKEEEEMFGDAHLFGQQAELDAAAASLKKIRLAAPDEGRDEQQQAAAASAAAAAASSDSAGGGGGGKAAASFDEYKEKLHRLRQLLETRAEEVAI